MANFLICYDVANSNRLGKVHRRIKSKAVFVQYSVYYFQGSNEELSSLLAELSEVIDEQEDDVRAYQVESLDRATRIGTTWFAEEVLLV